MKTLIPPPVTNLQSSAGKATVFSGRTTTPPLTPFAQRTFLVQTVLLPLMLLTFPNGLRAQAESSGAESEELVSLSPFVVEDRGYATKSVLQAQPRFGNDSGGNMPNVPITLIRPADAVVIEFALSNSSDKQDIRNKELTDSTEALAREIRAIPGLRF